jgi:carboxypeptidase Taq
VKDLPEAWGARMKADLGIEPPDDRDGALQDVHWYASLIGGQFQGYTIGNILSAQFFAAATRAQPGIAGEIALGEFGMLRTWLRENLYQHGAKFTAAELVERATGSAMSIEPYLEYLWRKYQPLYGLGGTGLPRG